MRALVLTLSLSFLPFALNAKTGVVVLHESIIDKTGLLGTQDRMELVAAMEDSIKKSEEYRLIERDVTRLKALLKEHALDQSGMVKGEQAGLTLLEPTEAILFVEVLSNPPRLRVRLSFKEGTYKTGEASFKRGDVDSMRTAVQDAMVLVEGKELIGKTASIVWRSALLPGWGQWYSGDSSRGKLFVGTHLALGALTITLAGQFNSAKSKHDSSVTNTMFGFALFRDVASPNYPLTVSLLNDQAAKSASRANSNGRLLNVAAAFWAGFYVFNLYDAWSRGEVKEEKKTAGFLGDLIFATTMESVNRMNRPENRTAVGYSWRF